MSIDLRNNPGFKPHADVHELAKYAYLKNIQKQVRRFKIDGARIKIEWIFPHCVGQARNKFDEQVAADEPRKNRLLFVKFITALAEEIEMPYDEVLRAFIGDRTPDQDRLRNVLSAMGQARNGSQLGLDASQ